MRSFIIFVGVLALACARHAPKNNNELSKEQQRLTLRQILRTASTSRNAEIFGYNESVMELLEGLIAKFPEGIPEKDIPVLEPFELEYQDVDLNLLDGLVQATGSVSDVKVVGLGGTKVTSINIFLIMLRFGYGFILPSVRLTGNYDLTGSLTILPFFGKGSFDIEVTNLDLTGFAKLGINDDGFLKLDAFDINIVLGDVKIVTTGLMDNPELNDLLDAVAQDLIKTVIVKEQQTVKDAIEKIAQEKADVILNTMTLGDLIELIPS